MQFLVSLCNSLYNSTLYNQECIKVQKFQYRGVENVNGKPWVIGLFAAIKLLIMVFVWTLVPLCGLRLLLVSISEIERSCLSTKERLFSGP